MRGQVDLLVVLSHVGFPQDVQFAKDVPGIDVIVSGHTHNRMEHAIDVNGCLIFQSGCHGSFIGRLDLDLQDGELVSRSEEHTSELQSLMRISYAVFCLKKKKN